MNNEQEHDPGARVRQNAAAQMDALRQAEQSAAAEEGRSMLAVQADPSVNDQHPTATVGGSQRHGVTWVRPTELAARSGARAAGYGIDFQAAISRRIRAGIGDAARNMRDAIRDRRDRLADLSMQGRDFPQTEPVAVEHRELGLR